jgi:hypothetical protein
MKVLVNGCSHLAGTELNGSAKIAKKLTWPNLISDWTDVVNLAAPSSSNDSICRRTIKELNKNTYDFVYVQWTHFDRIELQIPFHKDHGVTHEWFCINNGNAVEKSALNGNAELIFDVARSIFLKQFNNTWFDNYNVAQIVVLQSYLKSRNIAYQFGFVLEEEFKKVNETALVDMNPVVNLTWIDFCNIHRFQRLVAHYGCDAHEAYAQRLNLLRKSNDSLRQWL